MGKGYYVVSIYLATTAPLCGMPYKYGVITHHWLMQELQTEFKDQLEGVEMEVFRFVFMGSGATPEIGLSGDAATRELADYVQDTVEKLLLERPITELINFLAENDTDWDSLTAKIMDDE